MNSSNVADVLKIEDLVNTVQIVKRTESVDDTDDHRLDKAVVLHVTSSEEKEVPENRESSDVSPAVLLLEAEVMGDDRIAEHNDNAAVLKIEDLGNTGHIVKRTQAVDDTDDLQLDKAVDLHATSSKEKEVPEDKESSNVTNAVLLLQAEVLGDDGIAEHNDNIHKEGDNPESEITASRKRSLVEIEAGATHENSVRQKLSMSEMRPPRYFDPPEAFKPCKIIYANRKAKRSKKKKVCCICARLGHNGKSCPQANNCSNCSKKENENNAEEDNTTIFCLKCGSSGHDMFSCRNDYDPEDLENIQCYICKDFGHLCCTGNIIEAPSQASCYKCGESDHYGFECTKLNEVENDHQSVSLCSKCKKRIRWQQKWLSDVTAILAEPVVEKASVAVAVKPVKAKSRKSRRRERKKKSMPTAIASQSQPNMPMRGYRMPTTIASQSQPNMPMRGYRMPTNIASQSQPNMPMRDCRMPTFGPNMSMGGYRTPTFGQHYREPVSNVWLSPAAAAAARNGLNNSSALNQSSYQHLHPSSSYLTGGLPQQNFFNPGTVFPRVFYAQQPNHQTRAHLSHHIINHQVGIQVQQPNHQTRAHLSHHIINHQVGIQVPPNPWAPPPPKIFNQGTQIPRELQNKIQPPYQHINHQMGMRGPPRHF